jgi:hypothetical protein
MDMSPPIASLNFPHNKSTCHYLIRPISVCIDSRESSCDEVTRFEEKKVGNIHYLVSRGIHLSTIHPASAFAH